MAIKYEKPFLQQVIVNIQFASPYDELTNSLPRSLEERAKRFFPQITHTEVVLGNVEIKVGGSLNQPIQQIGQTKFMQWQFSNQNGSNRLLIDRNSMNFIIENYETFSKHKDEFIAVAKELYDLNADMEVRRFGLRYINIIDIKSGKPTSWELYLNTNLLGILKVPRNEAKIARAFHSLVLNYEEDDITLHFQYGMHNPDFPAEIRKKVFVLDFDAFHDGLIENTRTLEHYLVRCHTEIEALFESCIKQKTRDLMRYIEFE